MEQKARETTSRIFVTLVISLSFWVFGMMWGAYAGYGTGFDAGNEFGYWNGIEAGLETSPADEATQGTMERESK